MQAVRPYVLSAAVGRTRCFLSVVTFAAVASALALVLAGLAAALAALATRPDGERVVHRLPPVPGRVRHDRALVPDGVAAARRSGADDVADRLGEMGRFFAFLKSRLPALLDEWQALREAENRSRPGRPE